jgi:hypothetical protein
MTNYLLKKYFKNLMNSSILTDFILSQYNQLNPVQSQILHESLVLFFSGQKQFDQILNISHNLTQTKEPILRLKKILESCVKPPPLTQKMVLKGKKTRPWSIIDDNRLLAGILKFGYNWVDISNFVGNGRTKQQCAQRWIRALDPKICKDKWCNEEDEKLLELVKIHGEKKWTLIAEKFGNRTDVQCRYRYKQLTRKTRGSTTSDCQLPGANTDESKQEDKSDDFMKFMNFSFDSQFDSLFNFEDGTVDF